ncbi:lamin tail domain-containing protein [Streptomyces sp. LP11]|uniref:Lamin tail domain-containing protein n=1 Tax=Streptomyces pyxinicus TaxID=2970331 RepID=A0ABT2B935_9ACTN|nr:lamin tail domain-containing protein [Streptomyces sp. LP11]MCS0604967.1 lamin tail domain-containing protein [Streptomyces sp. LP11]
MTVSASVRRITAVTAVTAAALGAVVLPAAAADHHHPAPRHQHGAVYISGAKAHAPGRDDRNATLNNEWVAVTNSSRHAVSLNNWTLTDRSGHTYTFRHYSLGARSTVRVHTGVGHDTRKDLFQDRRKSVWDAKDTATLRNDHKRFVDDASWGRGRR